MNISSAVLRAHPAQVDSVRGALEKLPGVEVHAATSDGRLVVTLEDLEGLRAALLAHLESSQIDFRDLLITKTTTAPAYIDADGFARVGSWLLQVRDGAPVLINRISKGHHVMVQAVALLVRQDDAWLVTALDIERVRLR